MKKSKQSLGRNPLLPSNIHIADPEARVFNNKLYIYGSLDLLEDAYCSEEYRVVSTSDMRNFEVSEKSFDGKDVKWVDKKRKRYPAVDWSLKDSAPFFKKLIKDMHIPLFLFPKFLRPKNIDFGKFTKNKHILNAPDCIEKNGKYYLYFCLADQSEGVAVSDNPNGPFLNPIELPCAGIDPAIFIDDDGKSYYYWGQFRASAVELNEDMVSFDPNKVKTRVVTEEEHSFHEGSSMRKRNGIYYYVYPCLKREYKATCLAYATSSSPLGPFKYQGIIIDNSNCDPESWNIHGSIQEFNGEWYVFYHRSSNNSKIHRRLCCEKIYFNDDGSINEVKMTSIGAGEPFKINEVIEGRRACEVYNGAYINNEDLIMKNNTKATIRYVDFNKIPKDVILEKSGLGEIEILIDNKPFKECETGIHEVTILSKGDVIIDSLKFID